MPLKEIQKCVSFFMPKLSTILSFRPKGEISARSSTKIGILLWSYLRRFLPSVEMTNFVWIS